MKRTALYFVMARGFRQNAAGEWKSIGKKALEFTLTNSLNEAVVWVRGRLVPDQHVEMRSEGKVILMKSVGETRLRNLLNPADAPELDDFTL